MRERTLLKRIPFCWALLIATASASAIPITYSVSDTCSGMLGGTAFTNQTVVVSFFGDTSNVVPSAPVGFYSNWTGTAYVEIGGGASIQLTDLPEVRFFDNQGDGGTNVFIAGIADNDSILDTENNLFKTYTGSTALPATSGAADYTPGFGFATTAGPFTLFSGGTTSTFSASVPEPGSLGLILISAFGLCGTRRPFQRQLNSKHGNTDLQKKGTSVSRAGNEDGSLREPRGHWPRLYSCGSGGGGESRAGTGDRLTAGGASCVRGSYCSAQ